MLKTILGLWLVAILVTGGPPVQKLRNGEYLRLHVVAQDDSAEMQAMKLAVRDSVRQTYSAQAPQVGTPMLGAAQAMLPELARAARETAQTSGFEGEVRVTLGMEQFDTRVLDGHVIPAGTYPALMIRLGEAKGHNWWGLLDPETALEAASVQVGTGEIAWDWSWDGLWAVLRSWWGGSVDA